MSPSAYRITALLATATLFAACAPSTADSGNTTVASTDGQGQSAVQDNESMPDVVKVAVGSKDHSTLVAAIKAAGLVDALSNAGPFTVFAPVNDAFDKLPDGTLETLLKPENKGQLTNVLYHHVITSALEMSFFDDGQSVGMVDGTSEIISKRGDDWYIGDARVIGSVRASNGWVHVIDAVLVPH